MQLLSYASVRCQKPVTRSCLRTCDMNRIHCLQSIFFYLFATTYQSIIDGHHFNGIVFPWCNHVRLLEIRTLPKFIIQCVTPSIFHSPAFHQRLYAYLCHGFKMNPQIRLRVKRTVVAAVVEINAHLSITPPAAPRYRLSPLSRRESQCSLLCSMLPFWTSLSVQGYSTPEEEMIVL